MLVIDGVLPQGFDAIVDPAYFAPVYARTLCIRVRWCTGRHHTTHAHCETLVAAGVGRMKDYQFLIGSTKRRKRRIK